MMNNSIFILGNSESRILDILETPGEEDASYCFKYKNNKYNRCPIFPIEEEKGISSEDYVSFHFKRIGNRIFLEPKTDDFQIEEDKRYELGKTHELGVTALKKENISQNVKNETFHRIHGPMFLYVSNNVLRYYYFQYPTLMEFNFETSEFEYYQGKPINKSFFKNGPYKWLIIDKHKNPLIYNLPIGLKLIIERYDSFLVKYLTIRYIRINNKEIQYDFLDEEILTPLGIWDYMDGLHLHGGFIYTKISLELNG